MKPTSQSNWSSLNKGLASSIVTPGTTCTGKTDRSKGSSSQPWAVLTTGYNAIRFSIVDKSLTEKCNILRRRVATKLGVQQDTPGHPYCLVVLSFCSLQFICSFEHAFPFTLMLIS